MYYHNSYQQLEIYKLACEMSEKAWNVYKEMPQYLKYHMGDQLLRSADSIAANIAEGYGRFHYKDQIRFLYISRGSLFETSHWLSVLFQRDLISKNSMEEIQALAEIEGKKLNQYINYLKSKIHQVTK